MIVDALTAPAVLRAPGIGARALLVVLTESFASHGLELTLLSHAYNNMILAIFQRLGNRR